MIKIYDFFQKYKWVLWTVLIVCFGSFAYLGSQCRLEENIFKLLPQTNEGDATSVTFTNLKLKDKVFVQVVRKDSTLGAEYMAEAMDLFLETAVEKDSVLNAILNTLGEIDPLMLLDAADYLMQHGPSYIDLTAEQLDSLTSEEHIRQQVALYMRLLDTDQGANFYDIMAYDPCGISLSKLPFDVNANENADDTSTGSGTTGKFNKFQANHIFAGETEACIGFITPTFGTDDSKKANKLVNLLNEAKAEVESEYPGVEVMFHGTVILAGGNSSRIRKDLVTTIGVSLLLIILMLVFILKRPSYIAMMLVPVVFGALFSLATIYLVRGSMSLMALGLGAIVLGVALSYCLHVLIHYIYVGDVHTTLKEQTLPVLMGSITTVGSFAGLIMTSSGLLQDFGLFAFLGIVGTTLFSLMLMPQFLPKKNTANRKAFALLEKVNSYHIDRNKPICTIVIVWCLVCICFSGKYEFDSNLRNVGYISPEVQAASDSWNRLMNDGTTQQYYASVAPSLEEALEQMPAIEAVVDSLRKEGLVMNNVKTTAIMPSLKQQEARQEIWTDYFSEEKQHEVWGNVVRACRAEGIEAGMFEPFREAMAIVAEPELVAEAEIVPEEVIGNLYETLEDGTVLVYFPVRTSKEMVRTVADVLTQATGCVVLDPYYYGTNLVELIHEDFDKIMLISAGFVLLLLLFTYRNIWLALIAFLPMMVSWYTVLGAMALFHQPFNLINIVVSSFIFGIGVDYSIFILDGLRRGASKTMVYHKTAITMSAVILCVCMFSLVFAKHPALHSIAFASLCGMITTLLLSYTIQPFLYRRYMKYIAKAK